MAKFIKLHSADKEKTEILLNVDSIAYVDSFKGQTCIHFVSPWGNGSLVYHEVSESYEEVEKVIVNI